MAKRGRRKKNGARPCWMLLRTVMVLAAYDRARKRGEKHSVAIAETVLAVRTWAAEMPISETEVKRVLAEFRAKDSTSALIIKQGIAQPPEADSWFDDLKWAAEESRGTLKLPSFSHQSNPPRVRKFTIHVGPRPCYPRHNSKS